MHLQAYPDRQARRWQYVPFSRTASLPTISLFFTSLESMCPASRLRCAREPPSLPAPLACAAMRMTVDDGGSKRPVFDKLYTDAAQVG